MKTEEWKRARARAYVHCTGVPITAGADDRLSGSFRCSECGNPDEFFLCRRICCRRPEGFVGVFRHSKAQGESCMRHCDTRTHNRPTHHSVRVRPSFGSLEPSLEAAGIEVEGESEPPLRLCAFASMQQLCPRALCSGMTIAAQCDGEDGDIGCDRAAPGSNERGGKRGRRPSR